MNILYFAPVRLYPNNRGNTSTIHQYIKRLKNSNHRVHYVFFDEENTNSINIFLAQYFVDTLDVIKKRSFVEKKNPDGYFEFDSCYQNGLGETIKKLCKLYKINVIICTYVQYSKILDYVDNNIIKIIDTHDKMTDRHIFLKKNNIENEFFSCRQEDEARYLNRADIIWARRDEERDFFNAITQSDKAITVSHFNNPNFLQKDLQTIKKVGFFASDNNVNLMVIKNLVCSLLSNSTFLNSDIEILIAGDVKRMIEHDANLLNNVKKAHIKLLGFVENKENFYKNIDLAFIPISFGTGINVKIVEAMSFGLPVISTKIGSKGITTQNKYHLSPSLDFLINDLLEIYKDKSKIHMLEELSKKIYVDFFNANVTAFDSSFKKLK